MFRFVIFILLFTLSLGGTIQKVDISATPNAVGFSLIEYSFNIYNLPSAIPADGGLKIVFPSTFLVPSSLNIIPFQGLGSKTTPILTINGNTLSVTNGAPYSQAKISFVIFQENEDKQSIIPLTNQTGFIQFSTIRGNGIAIDSNNSIIISIIPANFVSKKKMRAIFSKYQSIGLRLSSSNPLTSAVSTLVINMSLIDDLTPNATLVVKLPVINPQAPENQQRNMIYNNNLISCTRKGEDGNKRLRFTVSGNRISITNAFKDSSYSQLVVEISNIVNPYSLSELAGFEVYLESQFGGFAFQETNAELGVSQPSRPKLVDISFAEKTVGQPTSFTFEIQPMNFFNPNDTIAIIFPRSFDLDQFSNTLQVQGFLQFTVVDNHILSFVSNYTEDNIKIQVSELSNVDYVVKSESFGVSITNSNGDLVAQQLWDLPYINTPGNITLVEFIASNNTIDALASYQISFLVQTNINQGNIEIIFPDAYPEFGNTAVSCEFLENINPNAICYFSENTVTIIDAFPLSDGTEKISFILRNITNPPFVPEDEKFVIQTTTTINNSTVDVLNEIEMNLTCKEIVIESFELLSNDISAPFGMHLLFKIPDTKIPNNSFIELTLDNSVSINTNQLSCSGRCLVNADNKIIFLNISQSREEESTLIEMQILSGLSNLRPAEPECLLDIVVKTPEGFTIAQQINDNSSKCFESEKIPDIGKISFSPIVPDPDVETNYILQFKTPFALKTLDQISIDFPNSESATTDPTLFIAGSEMKNTQLQFRGNTLFFPIEQNCNYSDPIQIILPNITNPWLSQGDALNITLKSEDQEILAKQSLTEEKVLILSDQLSILPSFEVSFSSLLVGARANLSMKFQSQRTIQPSDSILLKIPRDFEILSSIVECSFENDPAINLSCKANQTMMTMTQFSQALTSGAEYTILISSSIQNPLNNTKSSFYFLMDIVDSNDFVKSFGTYYLQNSFLCNSNCKSCRDNAARCFECHPGKFLFEGTCLARCPESYFEENNQCQKCNLANCEKCRNSTFCEKCRDHYQVFEEEGKCIFDQTMAASGINHATEILQRYLIPLVFMLCLLLAIGLKYLYRKKAKSFSTNMTILMNLFLPLLLIWLLIETVNKKKTPTIIFCGCSIFLVLLQQMIIFRLLKGVQIKPPIFKILTRVYNYKIGLYHHFNDANFMIILIGLVFDGVLMLIVAVVSGSEAVSNLQDDLTKFIFLLEAGCFALVLGLFEIYLAMSGLNKLFKNQNHESENTEIDKSALNNLRSRTYISKANEEKTVNDSSVFEISSFRLRRNVPAEAEITSNEISFQVKSANRNILENTPRESNPQKYIQNQFEKVIFF